jgi:uncharacterized membrane protein
LLVRTILACQPMDSILAGAIGSDVKGNVSLALYAVGIPLTFISSWIAVGVYTVVALIWLIPDRRIEHLLSAAASHSSRE